MQLNLNFASRRYVNRKAINRGYWIVATALLGFLVWGSTQGLLTRGHILQSQGQLANLQQDQQELLGTRSVPLDSRRIEEIRRQFAQNQKLLDQDAFRWTALFDRMERLLPAGISIRGFKPDYEERTLAIEGVARDLSSLQEFLDRLLGSDAISNAYLNRQAFVSLRDAQGTERSALSFSVNLEGVF
jgi:type IV pilus assembly protein PilN